MAADDAPSRSVTAAASATRRSVRAIIEAAALRARALTLTIDAKDGEIQVAARGKASTVASQVMRAMRDAGDEARTLTEDRAVAAALAVIGDREVSEDALSLVESAVQPVLADMARVTDETASEARATVSSAPSASRQLADLEDDVDSLFGVLRAKLESAADAAVMGAGRGAIVALAEESSERMGYVYLGPNDGKIRPFCRKHVGKVYTREALDRLDNGDGQPKPVSVHLGGYGCRHIPSPILLDDARSEGFTVRT